MKRLLSRLARLRQRRSRSDAALNQGVRSEQMEKRVLFSADVPWASDAAAFVDARDREQEREAALATDQNTIDLVQQLPPLVVFDPQFTDETHSDLMSLLRGADADMQMVDPDADIVAQLSDWLGERTPVQSVHLFGGADAAVFTLGSDRFDTDFVLNRASDIAEWRNYLAPDARLDLYAKESVDIAQWSHTRDLLTSLTGAKVQLHEPDAAARMLTINRTQDNSAADESVPVEQASANSSKEGINRSEVRSFNATVQTVVVTNLTDTVNGDTTSMANLSASDGGDGISLREAILALNEPTNGTGPHRIEFNISGAGPHTINLASALPAISNAVIIDGTTEPDFAGTPMIVLDASTVGGGADMLVLASGSGGSTIRGLVIKQFAGNAIEVQSGSDGNTIVGNYLGTNPAGTGIDGGGGARINLLSDNNVVGGSSAADRNVIGGGSLGVVIDGGSTNTVSGNYIGVDVTGNASLTISGRGVQLLNDAANNTIGGTTAAHGNVIANITNNAIEITGSGSSNNTVQNNLIGVNADGLSAPGVSAEGVRLNSAGSANEILDNHIGNANFSGIFVTGSTDGTIIQGNLIGTDSTLTQDWGTRFGGVEVDFGPTNTIIGGIGAGEGNTIAFSSSVDSGFSGISVGGSSTQGTTIRGNSIFGSDGIGIDLNGDGVSSNDANDADTGANGSQNFAVLTSAGIDGNGDFAYVIDTTTLSSGGGPYIIDFYSNTDPEDGNVEGRRYLGSVTGVADGQTVSGTIAGVTLAPGEYVVLTTTDSAGNTSEFSNDVQATVDPPYDLQVIANAGNGLEINNDGGNDTYLVADDGGALLGGLTELSFEIQFETQSTGVSVLTSYATADDFNEFALLIQADGSLLILMDDNTRTISAATFDFDTLRDGDVHSLAFVWDNSGGNYTVYADGVSVATGSGLRSGLVLGSGGTLVFGQEQDSLGGGFVPTEVFSGTLYSARLFSDLRTSLEIAASHDSVLPHSEGDMLAQWQFDRLSTDGVVIEDVSGNNLTVQSVSDPGFISSTPVLPLSVDENANRGTIVGTVSASDVDRQARIDALLAADSSLVYSAETNQFYRLSSGFTNVTTAQTNAAAFTLNGEAGQLATIQSAHEQEIIFNLIGGSNAYLGAADATVDGEWRWLDGTSEGDLFWVGDDEGYAPDGAYTNWLSGRPDGSTSQSALIIRGSDGLWDDETGGTSYRSVYQWDADAVLDQTDPLVYTIQLQTEDGAFAIDSSTGLITVADGSLLDYETDDTHIITVLTTDADGNTYDEAVTVSLRDLTESATAPTDLTSGIELNSDGGNDAYLVADNGGAILGGLTSLTFETTFQIAEPRGDNVLIDYGTSGTDDGFRITVKDYGDMFVTVNGLSGSFTAFDYSELLLDGQPHHFAVTWDSTTGEIAIFVDGELVESKTDFFAGQTIPGSAGDGTLIFGQDQDTTNNAFDADDGLSGTLYDVRIWNEARSVAEIALNYQNGLDVTPTEAASIGLIANWQMEFDGSNEVVDTVSGNNLNTANVGVTSPDPITSYSNSTSGVTTSSNSITFSDDGLGTGWLSQTNSVTLASMGYTDNFRVSFTVDSITNGAFVFGLSESEGSTHFSDIDHAIYIDVPAGSINAMSNGSSAFTINSPAEAGDVLSFHVHDGVIDYELNGVVFYSEAFTPTSNTYIDTSFYSAAFGSYSNQDDYTLSNIGVVSTGFTDSTPLGDLHVAENSADGTGVGFVTPSDPYSQQDIVSDGSFTEGGDGGGAAWSRFTSGQTFGDWTVDSGDVDLGRTNVEAPPLGGYSLDLSGSVAGAVSQTLDTVAGQQYQVVFALSGDWDSGPDVKEFLVSAGGESTGFFVTEPSGWSGSNMLWDSRSFTFTADSDSTLLQFISQTSSANGAIIANVQVIEISPAISAILNDDPTLSYDAATDKFYRYVDTEMTWSDAQANAIASQVNGVSGQLVRIDSAYENALVLDMNIASYGIFLGASDTEDEGEFRWYDGDQPGDLIWSGGAGGSAESNIYTNFNAPPDDFGGAQDYLVQRSSDGEWDDVTNTDVNHSIIEWDASEVLSNYTFSLTDDADGR
ncbi:MAG: LamG-like jellyroll fold domain-containing protein, partial [Gammaproteobacteria bacterium]